MASTLPILNGREVVRVFESLDISEKERRDVAVLRLYKGSG
jgi:hypothetical protein